MSKFVNKMIKGAAISAATTTIAKMLHLDDTLVGKVLTTGATMMTFLAADDPSVSDLLFKDAQKRKKNKKHGIFSKPEEAENHFFSIFGDRGRAMNKAIAEETGATEKQVNSIMGLFLPTFEDALLEEDIADEKGMQGFFKKEKTDAKKDPSLARMMTKMIF